MILDRRGFLLAGAAGLAAGSVTGGEAEAASPHKNIPIIDTHVHLWDLTRPQGAPFPTKAIVQSMLQHATPAQARFWNIQRMTAETYHRENVPSGVVGLIAVDASPWIEDNLWLLETCADDNIMVGCVGNLKPEAGEFPEYLERYHRNPLFLGIRYGNVWGYDIAGQVKNPDFLSGLKLMAQAGLVLDVGNPEMRLLESIIRINDAVPDLKIVAEHLALVRFKPPPAEQAAFNAVLREFNQRPRIFGKITVSDTPGNYDETLDLYCETFGEDRVVGYGFCKIDKTLEVMKAYYASKSREAAEKYFWKNSAKLYNWVHRAPDQP